MKLFAVIFIIVLSVVAIGLYGAVKNAPDRAFSRLNTDDVNTMVLFEDGSYQIQYNDGAAVRGCLKGRACND